MNIEQREHTLSIGGLRELTAANAESVRVLACAAVTPNLRTIEVDLSETTMMDSFGLGVITTLYKTASEGNRHGSPAVRLLNPQPPVQQVLELTRLHHLFEIVLQTSHAAVNASQQPRAIQPAATP